MTSVFNQYVMIGVQTHQRFVCMADVSPLKNRNVYAVIGSHATMEPAQINHHHQFVKEILTVCLHFTVIL